MSWESPSWKESALEYRTLRGPGRPMSPAEFARWRLEAGFDDASTGAVDGTQLAAKGFSTRRIAEITGWSFSTIAQDLRVQDRTESARNRTPTPSTTGGATTKERRAEIAAAAAQGGTTAAAPNATSRRGSGNCSGRRLVKVVART
jgi:hypothetical protein